MLGCVQVKGKVCARAETSHREATKKTRSTDWKHRLHLMKQGQSLSLITLSCFSVTDYTTGRVLDLLVRKERLIAKNFQSVAPRCGTCILRVAHHCFLQWPCFVPFFLEQHHSITLFFEHSLGVFRVSHIPSQTNRVWQQYITLIIGQMKRHCSRLSFWIKWKKLHKMYSISTTRKKFMYSTYLQRDERRSAWRAIYANESTH